VAARAAHGLEIEMKVEGSVALVTGANGGIGRALVEELLKRGAAKIYAGVRDSGSVQSLFEDQSRVIALQLDVSRPDQVAKAAVTASDVTLLVNNAGFIGGHGALSVSDLAAARQEMEVNYFGPLALAQAFRNTPALKGGAMINILSFLSLVTIPQAGTYSASKAAALSLTRVLRAELKARGSQVLAVLPVQVDTPLGKAMPDPKLKPSEVAIHTLDALEAGKDEVFPGALSEGAAAAFKADPAGLQAKLAAMVHAID
jgi:short-subunit dehydrogenase